MKGSKIPSGLPGRTATLPENEQFAPENRLGTTRRFHLFRGKNLSFKGLGTPPKTNMEPKNCLFVDVSPFPRGYFQVPCLFSGV